jgi:hypothetical protein
MALFAGIAGLISILVCWLVTARLASLARRSRAAPERLLAIALGSLYGVGYPLAAISRAPGLNLTHEGSLLFAIGAIGMVVGIAALGRFPQVVFRPGERWAWLLNAGITLGGIAGGAGCAVSVARAESAQEMIALIQPWAVILMSAVTVSFIWNGAESAHYYRNMKRRLALGLAQAETTHRFLLWAIASWSTAGSIAALTAMRAAGIATVSALPMAVIAISTFVASGCWWLAFFMPNFYRRRVLGVSTEAPLEAG